MTRPTPTAAQLISAEPVLCAGRQQLLIEQCLLRVIGGGQRRGQRDRGEHTEDQQPPNCATVAAEALPHFFPRTRRADAGAALGLHGMTPVDAASNSRYWRQGEERAAGILSRGATPLGNSG